MERKLRIGDFWWQASGWALRLVAYMDKLVGRFVKKTKEFGIADDTLIMFLGDNGTHRTLNSELGDKTIKGGKGATTNAGKRVPLIISIPGKKVARVETLTELVNIYPTLAEVVGLKPPKSIVGRSLLPAIDDPKATVRDVAFSGDNGKRAARTKS